MLDHGADSANPPIAAQDIRYNRWCHFIAVVVTIGWFLAYNQCRPDYFVDEAGHMGNIYHFLEGKPDLPPEMTMLPGYHFMVAGLWQFHPPLKLLTLARLVTTVCALFGLVAFALAWRRFHGQPAGWATLLVALLPLLQPFTGMAYTDVPALAFVLCAWWAHLAGHRAAAAALLAVACCLRQTSVVWAGFIVLWETMRTVWPSDGRTAPPADVWKSVWVGTRWMLPVLLGAALVALAAGRLTVGRESGNEFQPNVATLHLAGVMLTLLGLPLVPEAAAALASRLRDTWRRRPAHLAVGLAAAAGAVALLAMTFRNSHEWNRTLFWPGESFTLLRNWPLVWIERLPVLRIVSALNLVLLVGAMTVALRRQPFGRELALALAVGSMPAAGSSLVEPRYFIPPLVFALFFITWDRQHLWRLIGWFGLLSALHAPFVASRLSLW